MKTLSNVFLQVNNFLRLSMEVTMVKKVCSFLLSLLLVSAVNAIELSYEGFEGYSEGNLVGLETLGTGYQADAVWKSFGSDANFQSQGLTYPGLPTAGGSIVTIDSGSALYANLDLSEEGPFAGLTAVLNAGTDDEKTLIGGGDIDVQVYISFLVQGEYNNNWGGMTLYNPGELLLFGRTWQHQYFSTTLQDNPAIGDPGTEFDVDKTHMVIVKIDFNDGTDDISVWIDPDLSKNEASQDPSKRVDGQKSDAAFNFAVFRGDGIWHYDELRIGKTWRDVVGDRKSAIVAFPADQQVNIPVQASLVWRAGEEATPSEYKVYLSKTSDQITESDLVATTPGTIFTPATQLDKDTTYYWRVDSVIMENNEPNTITGAVWSFDTELTVPVISRMSNLVFGSVGETVVIDVAAVDPLNEGLNYAWYIGEVGDTSNPVGTDSSELLVEITDIDVYANKYWCKVSNAAASVNSGSAIIIEKMLLAHWPLESDPDPNSNSVVAATPDSPIYLNPNNSGASVQTVNGVVGGALEFNEACIVTDVNESSYFDPMNDFCSVTCWVKSSNLDDWVPFVSRNGEANGWQMREVWYSDTAGFTTRGTGNQDGSASGIVISDGQWHFVAATFDSNRGEKKIYIDGLLRVTDSTGLSPISPSTEPVVLAARAYSPTDISGYNNNLSLDEVKLYNYPLTYSEVADEYLAVAGTLCVYDIPADYDKNCKVDLVDLSILAGQWLNCSAYPECIDFD